MISQRILRALFSYDIDTGYLSWKDPKKGRIDHKGSQGYSRACLFGSYYSIQKLVWLYHYGYYPEKILDHKNGIKTDNRIENLREVSAAENCRNRPRYKNNSSGVRGVSWNKGSNTWIASIQYNKKFYSLGSSKDFTEAVYLRYTAEKCFDWDSFKYQSTAYQYIKLFNTG